MAGAVTLLQEAEQEVPDYVRAYANMSDAELWGLAIGTAAVAYGTSGILAGAGEVEGGGDLVLQPE